MGFRDGVNALCPCQVNQLSRVPSCQSGRPPPLIPSSQADTPGPACPVSQCLSVHRQPATTAASHPGRCCQEEARAGLHTGRWSAQAGSWQSLETANRAARPTDRPTDRPTPPDDHRPTPPDDHRPAGDTNCVVCLSGGRTDRTDAENQSHLFQLPPSPSLLTELWIFINLCH